MAFAHLHVHTQFSLLDGAIKVKKLPKAVAALEQTAVAVTDHCNLYGAVTFDKTCKDYGVHPVFGAGLWLQPEGLAFQDPRGDKGGYHLVCLIEDQRGYQNLCKLITTAIFDGMFYKPRIDLDLLRAHNEGLIVLTSGMRGPVRGHVVRGEREKARENLNLLGEILGPERLFLELQDVGFEGDDVANAGCRELAADLGLQTVVTNAVHYLKPHDAPVLEVLQCIGSGVSLNDPGRNRPLSDQLYLKSEAEMRELFPDDLDAIERTQEIADRCQFKFTYGTYYFPASSPPDKGDGTNAGQPDTDPNWEFFYRAFPPPEDFNMPKPEVAIPPRPEGAGCINGYFEWYASEGLKLRLQHVPEEEHPAYWERLKTEFHIVENMPGGGFAAYFLIVAEFINWAKDHDIPVGPGRGSAAGSLAAYAMRITNIDPIRFDLLFERFLNPERVSMPDVDVDFCQDRREEVIEHTRQKYGPEYVAQIITYGKLQAKAALKDVSRIADLTFNDSNRIAKLVPEELGITLEKALEEEGFQNYYDGDTRVRRIVNLAQGIEGLTRQTGVHAAGVVVADRPLVELVPLYRDGPEGGPVVQFDMKSAEEVGLIKFDFLGLKTLDQIRDAIAMIHRNTGEEIDPDHIPIDDARAYELLCRGDALGVFQVESSGMRELLTKLRPSCLDDLVALVALYRPGPLNAGMVDDFIDCKHGRKAVVYPLPQLEPILKSTYGVVVYQEQVMQIAQSMASYSLGEADLLRRAMGKKKAEAMAAQEVRFLDGSEKNGIAREKAKEIFDLLAMFAAYGFNKSHSAAYGYVSYQTAWLKANHRAEYMAALMSIEANNTDKVLVYIGDCRRSGIEILPPDINESLKGFDVPRDNRRVIRFGMGAVKSVGANAVEAILEARAAAGGSFRDLMDCLERLDYKRVNVRVLEQLIRCGAFDWTGYTRAGLREGLEGAISVAQRTQADKASGQVSLFGAMMGGGPKPPTFKVPDVPEWSTAKRLAFEKEALGFFISGHPVQAFAAEVKRYASCTIDQLETRQSESTVTIACMPSSIRKIRTKRGDRMAFVQLEDDTGPVEAIFFADPWAASQRVLEADQPILVKGTLEKKSDGCKILGESAELLSDLRAKRTREVHVELLREDLRPSRIRELKALIEQFNGRCAARLHVISPGRSEVVIHLPEAMGLRADDEMLDGFSALLRRNDAVRFV